MSTKHTATFEELTQRAINAVKSADGEDAHGLPQDQIELSLAAARAWINRAQYSLRNGGELCSSDFEIADKIMFQELLGDYSESILVSERDRLREALRFYANPKNYKGDNTDDLSDGGIDRGGGYRLSANCDGGKIARAALNREGEK